MRKMVVGRGVLAIGVVLAACASVFMMGGAMDRLTAERALAAHGFGASEARDAPGYVGLLLPAGWKRDTRIEYMDDNLAGRPQSREPRTVIHAATRAYTSAQLVALGVSIQHAAELDLPALMAAREAHRRAAGGG